MSRASTLGCITSLKLNGDIQCLPCTTATAAHRCHPDATPSAGVLKGGREEREGAQRARGMRAALKWQAGRALWRIAGGEEGGGLADARTRSPRAWSPPSADAGFANAPRYCTIASSHNMLGRRAGA